MNNLRKLAYFLAIAIITLDQWSKYLVITKLSIGTSKVLIPSYLYFTSHRNEGAAWGILQGKMWFFYIITVVVLCVMFYYIQKHANDSILLAISLGLVLGGTIGNFYDRFVRHAVVDFIHTPLFDFPIFNVADMALSVGVGCLILYILLDEMKRKKSLNG